MTRKEFLTLCLAGSAAPALRAETAEVKAAHAAMLFEGPMLGHTTDTSARIWVRATGPARLSVRVWSDLELADARVVEGPALVEDAACTGQVELTGLVAGQAYFYDVLFDGHSALTRPFPWFVTTPAAGAKGGFRFAFTSCVGQNGYDAAAGWGEMAERGGIDFLLMLGDNHYANTVDPVKQRAYYAMHRQVAGFAKLARGTPVYGIWDDHDFGPNNSDGTLEGKERTLQTFREHWANPAFGEPDNPGVYFKFSRGDVDFFMLDVRYHRSPNKTPQDESKTMLGARQLAWLKRELIASRATLKFIASGSEWQSHGTDDSWMSFARERQEIFDFIGDNNITAVVLLSGDRHFTAAYQVLDRWIEVTSGPIGSGNAQAKQTPESFLSCSVGKMWCVFDVDTAGDELKLALEVWQASGGMIERRTFTWGEVNGRAKIAPSPPLPKPPAPAKRLRHKNEQKN